ncbi:MAG TPA: xanthine dehydrogenase family protein molybdopterin-binding subunit, partial [Gemmatimonadaceae bacterium]
MTTPVGKALKRREDPRLITGSATYTDDIQLPRMAYAAVLRSPWAHARVRSIDAGQARTSPGVIAVFTGRDLAERVNPVPCAWMVPNCELKVPPHPMLAVDTVRYVGDGVAFVVAESREAARDALDLIEVDYEPLRAVVDPEQATQPDAPQLHGDIAGNVAFTWTVAGGDADAAFASAPVAVDLRIVHQRLLPSAMETRAAVASYTAGSGQLTLHVTSQNPHICRFLCSVMLKLPEHRIRVVAPEVGGAFGSKIPTYADEALACFAAMELGRPVKWTEDRSENYKVTTHGRDHVSYVELCGTPDGTITGLRARVFAGLGAYASTAAPGVPTILHGLMYSGPYAIPNIKGVIKGVYTTGTPVDAYRGAGRPEATYMLERLIDLFARKLGKDPVEVRRKNLIPKESFPHTVVTGLTYDSGNYEGALDTALTTFDYAAFRAEQAAAREEKRYLGIGVTTYNEI